MRVIGFMLGDGAAEGGGHGDEVVTAEDHLERIDDPGAHCLGGAEFLVRAAPAGIQACPDDGIIIAASTFQPRGVHPGCGMSAEHRIGLRGLGEGEA